MKSLRIQNVQHNNQEKSYNFLFSERTSDYKHLRGGVYFVDQLPILPTGKISRSGLKQLLQ